MIGRNKARIYVKTLCGPWNIRGLFRRANQIKAAKKLVEPPNAPLTASIMPTLIAPNCSADNRTSSKVRPQTPNISFRSSKKFTALDNFLIPVCKIPPNNLGILGATDYPSRIKLQLEHSSVRLPNLWSICIRGSRSWHMMRMERRRRWQSRRRIRCNPCLTGILRSVRWSPSGRTRHVSLLLRS